MTSQIGVVRLELTRLCAELGETWSLTEGRSDAYGLHDAEYLEVQAVEKCSSIRLFFYGAEIRLGAYIAGTGEIGEELTSLATEELSDIVERLCRSDYAIESNWIHVDTSRRRVKLERWPENGFDCANPWGD